MSKPQAQRTAFPSAEEHTDGLSKREWFAGQALKALAIRLGPETNPASRTNYTDSIAQQCVEYADAVLAALFPPDPAEAPELVAKPAADRHGGEYGADSGVLVRARLPEGGYEPVLLEDLDRASLLVWLRSKGGRNPLAENTVGQLLGAGRLTDE
jgi:hypothetical protein